MIIMAYSVCSAIICFTDVWLHRRLISVASQKLDNELSVVGESMTFNERRNWRRNFQSARAKHMHFYRNLVDDTSLPIFCRWTFNNTKYHQIILKETLHFPANIFNPLESILLHRRNRKTIYCR